MKHTKHIFIVAMLLCALSPGTAHTWPAQVLSVHDGDTITVTRLKGGDKTQKKIKVRLYGVDAPELKQPAGKESALWLQKRLPAETMVNVKPVSRDRYRRTVGIVSVTGGGGERGETINAELVNTGNAWVYSQFCKRKECREWMRQEMKAREARLGLWAGSEQLAPWLWRKAKKQE